MAAARKAWQPSPVQRQVLVELADVYEVLYAGQVGGGKTDLVVMAPLVYPEYRDSAHFKGLILRHDEKDLDKEILPRSKRPDMYPAYVPAARLLSNKKAWVLPAGGRVIFTHAKDLLAHWGPEYQYLGWDELTHFTEEQYLFLLGRLRSSVGLPIRVRAGANPLGPGKAWVKRRWGPWLQRDYLRPRADAPAEHHVAAESLRLLLPERRDAAGKLLPPAVSGQVLWYTSDEEGREIWVPEGTPGALSRAWMNSRTDDNPALREQDPAYKTRLRSALRGALGAGMAGGDWDAEEVGPGFFRRDWFQVVPAAARPTDLVQLIRRWDFAWTKKRRSDYSVGVLFGQDARGRWWLLDVVRTKGLPHEVEQIVKQTAVLDGIGVPVVLPIDFSAGLYVEASFVRLLAGFQVFGVRERGEKEVRIATLQPQAKAGNLWLVAGPWVPDFLAEAERYPKDAHDDQLDALAGAFLHLTDPARPPTVAVLQEDAERFGELARELGRAVQEAEPGWEEDGGWGGADHASW